MHAVRSSDVSERSAAAPGVAVVALDGVYVVASAEHRRSGHFATTPGQAASAVPARTSGDTSAVCKVATHELRKLPEQAADVLVAKQEALAARPACTVWQFSSPDTEESPALHVSKSSYRYSAHKTTESHTRPGHAATMSRKNSLSPSTVPGVVAFTRTMVLHSMRKSPRHAVDVVPLWHVLEASISP